MLQLGNFVFFPGTEFKRCQRIGNFERPRFDPVKVKLGVQTVDRLRVRRDDTDFPSQIECAAVQIKAADQHAFFFRIDQFGVEFGLLLMTNLDPAALENAPGGKALQKVPLTEATAPTAKKTDTNASGLRCEQPVENRRVN